MAKLDDMLRSPSKIRKHIETLKEEVEYLRQKQRLLEEEAALKRKLEDLHPSKTSKAFKAIGQVLGGVQKEIRGTPAQRISRRKKLKSTFKKIKEALEEEKAGRKKKFGY